VLSSAAASGTLDGGTGATAPLLGAQTPPAAALCAATGPGRDPAGSSFGMGTAGDCSAAHGAQVGVCAAAAPAGPGMTVATSGCASVVAGALCVNAAPGTGAHALRPAGCRK
jgi:hypothetical protein